MGIHFHIDRNAGSYNIDHSLPRMENDENTWGNDVYPLLLLHCSSNHCRILSRSVLRLNHDRDLSALCHISADRPSWRWERSKEYGRNNMNVTIEVPVDGILWSSLRCNTILHYLILPVTIKFQLLGGAKIRLGGICD